MWTTEERSNCKVGLKRHKNSPRQILERGGGRNYQNEHRTPPDEGLRILMTCHTPLQIEAIFTSGCSGKMVITPEKGLGTRMAVEQFKLYYNRGVFLP